MYTRAYVYGNTYEHMCSFVSVCVCALVYTRECIKAKNNFKNEDVKAAEEMPALSDLL